MYIGPGTKCVVVGLGISGMAAVRFLHEAGARVAVSEAAGKDRVAAADLAVLEELGVRAEFGGHTETMFNDAELVVPSPGVPLDLPVLAAARGRGVTVAGELALAAGRFTSPVIAVTGSNGKTTVTSLIGHLLRTAGIDVFIGGNIGNPILNYLRAGKKAQVAVLELSSFQLEISGRFRPDIALLLNISPDHLDRHGSIDGYAAAKRRIFANQGSGDTAILGGDDPLVVAEEVKTAGRVLRFGFYPGSDALVTGQGVSLATAVNGRNIEEEYDLSGTALCSGVNRLNAAAALLAVRVADCRREDALRGLGTFVPPAHRMTPVAEVDGVRYIDDSKGTNIGAVAAALAGSGDRIVLIAGGRNKGGDFSLLRSTVAEHVRHLILIGEAAGDMERQLGAVVPVSRAASMEDAVHRAAELATAGDTVLLSPACASFDMFSGYAERGDVFARAVLELQQARQQCG